MKNKLLAIALFWGMLFIACSDNDKTAGGVVIDAGLAELDTIVVRDTIKVKDTVIVKDKQKPDTVKVVVKEKQDPDTVKVVVKEKQDPDTVKVVYRDTVEKPITSVVYDTVYKDSSELAKIVKYTGVAQKGPFVKGSKVTIFELDESLEPTGISFTALVSDGGKFSVDTYAIGSKQILVKVEGRYLNELNGDISDEPVTLYSLYEVNSSCTTVNVNVFTHLIYSRIKHLLTENPSQKYVNVKNKAEGEMFIIYGLNANGSPCSEALDVFGTSEPDAALLGASVMMVSIGSLGGMADSLEKLTADFADNGKLDNPSSVKMQKDLAYNLKQMDLVDHFENVVKNVKSMNNGNVNTGFLKFLRYHWQITYGFPACGSPEAPAGTVVELTRDGVEPLSTKHEADRYTCVDSSDAQVGFTWRPSELIDYDTCGIVANEGDLVRGKYSDRTMYVLDNGVFRTPYIAENYLNAGCVSATEGDVKMYGKSSFECKKGRWTFDKAKSKQANVNDARDTLTYETIAIGNNIWMTENLKYHWDDPYYCYDGDEMNCYKYGALFTLSAIVLDPSDIYQTGKENISDVCPTGWHVATTTEFSSLVNFAKVFSYTDDNQLTSLKSTSGWSGSAAGTDLFGFKALAAGEATDTGHFLNRDLSSSSEENILSSSSSTSKPSSKKLGETTTFWERDIFAQNMDFAYSKMEILKDSYTASKDADATSMHSVRCVKDD